MDKFNNDSVDKSLLSHSDSETNKSFVKKVTSRVSGLIPSSLSKWFGSKEECTSTVRQREDTDDEDDDYVNVQPPSKRQRKDLNNDNHVNYLIETSSSTNVLNFTHRNNYTTYEPPDDTEQPGPSNCTRSKHLEVVVNKNDKETDSTGSNTSGYSSQKNENNYDSSPPKTVIQANHIFNNTPRRERSLFVDKLSSPQTNTSLSSRRPSFDASTFEVNKSILTSPFYKGRTTYGGASAYNKIRYLKNTPEKSLCRSVQITPNNDVKKATMNDKTSLSKTARRILETLEHYTTPLTETKKIPVPVRKNNSTYTNHPYLNRNKPTNKELQIPTVPDLLKMKLKERLQDSTVSVRQLANTSKSDLNKREYAMKSKHSNKMKTKLTSTRVTTQSNDNSLLEVELPNVQLPITTLPKFDFNLSNPTTCTTSTPKEKPQDKEIEVIKEISPSPPPKELQFTFSKPIVIAKNMKHVKAINDFNFSVPILKKGQIPVFKTPENGLTLKKHNGDNTAKELITTGSVMDVLGKKESLADKLKNDSTWECTVCLIKNKNEDNSCAACQNARTQQLIKNEQSDLSKFRLSAEKWECTTCLVRNNNTDNTCVACTTPKRIANGAIVPTTKPSNIKPSDLSTLFKPPANTWECTVCMIRNKDDLNKCAACETPKPGTSKGNNLQTFGESFKKKESEWECPSCMVRNTVNNIKCVCCEAAKPGSKAVSVELNKPKEIKSTFNFGIDKSAFTFGVKPIDSTTGFKIGNQSEKNENGASTTFKFGAPQQTNNVGFTFGVPKKDTIEKGKEEAVQSPPLNGPSTFTFGTSTTKDSSTSKLQLNQDATTYKFGSVSSANDANSPPAAKRIILSDEEEQKKLNFFDNNAKKADYKSKPTFNFDNPKESVSFGTSNDNVQFGATKNSITFGSSKDNVMFAGSKENLQFGCSKDNTLKQTVFTFGSKSTPIPEESKDATMSNPSKQSTAFGTPKEALPFDAAKNTQSFGTPKTTTNFGTPIETSLFGSTKEPNSFGTCKESTASHNTNKTTSIFGGTKHTPTFGGSSSNVSFGTPTGNMPFRAIKENEPQANVSFGTTKVSSPFGVTKDNSPFVTPKDNSQFGSSKDNSLFAQSKSNISFGAPKDNITFGVNKDSASFGVSKSNVTFGGSKDNVNFAVTKDNVSFVAPKHNASFDGSKDGASFGTSKESVNFAAPKDNVQFGVQKGNVMPFEAPKNDKFGSSSTKQSTPSSTVPKETFTFAESKSFTFGNNTQQNPSSIFNSNQPNSSLFAFGTNKKQETGSLFSVNQKDVSKPSNIFGSTATNTNIFGSTSNQGGEKKDWSTFTFNSSQKPPESSATNTSALFSFGSANAANQPTTSGFNFNTPTASTSSDKNTNKNLFNPSQQQNPFDNNPSATPVNGGFVFNNPTTATPKPTFNFTSNTQAPSGLFNFGSNSDNSQQSTATLPPATGYNFGNAAVPQFNANARPTFNFTGGTVTPAFSATGTPSDKPQRLVRKALRRTQR